jgi:hypothetical protein
MRHRSKFSRPWDQAAGVCASLDYITAGVGLTKFKCFIFAAQRVHNHAHLNVTSVLSGITFRKKTQVSKKIQRKFHKLMRYHKTENRNKWANRWIHRRCDNQKTMHYTCLAQTHAAIKRLTWICTQYDGPHIDEQAQQKFRPDYKLQRR